MHSKCLLSSVCRHGSGTTKCHVHISCEPTKTCPEFLMLEATHAGSDVPLLLPGLVPERCRMNTTDLQFSKVFPERSKCLRISDGYITSG